MYRRLEQWFELGPAEANRLLPMEGLRGLAVLLVFFVHFGAQIKNTLWLQIPGIGIALQTLGHAGVDLFFVLSGYLIYGMTLRRPRPYLGFLGRRAQRLYPTFLVVLVLELGMALASTSRGYLPTDSGELAATLVANLLFLPGVFPIKPIVTVAWSLSYEVAFYLVVPVLVGGLRMRAWPPVARAVLMVLAVWVMAVTGWQHGRMGMFVCGMLLVEALPQIRSLDRQALISTAVCGAVLLTAGHGHRGIVFMALFVTCFLVCGAAFAPAGSQGLVARALSWQPLRWLGNMSYSYYLAHGLVLDVLFRVLRKVMYGTIASLGEAAWFVLLGPAFMATLIGSAALFLLVERPYSILPSAKREASPSPVKGLIHAE